MTDPRPLPNGVTPEMDAGYDLLTDVGFTPDKAASMMVTAQAAYTSGAIQRNPEQFARHVLKLRKAARDV